MSNNKYQIAIEALREREQELNKELESLRITINSLLSSSSGIFSVSNDSISNVQTKSLKFDQNKASYKADFNVKSVVMDIIESTQRFMHFREIAEVLIKEKDLNVKSTVLSRELSTKTINLKKKGAIVKFQFGTEARNTFWGKPEWLNRNGGIINGYEYNTDYISDNLNPKNFTEVELYG